MSRPQRSLTVVLIAAFALVSCAGGSTQPPSTPTNNGASSGLPGANTPAATALNSGPVSVISPRYGYIVIAPASFSLVSEDGARIQDYVCGANGAPCDDAKIAVSPDGKRVAFWTRAGPSYGVNCVTCGSWELRVFDAASPTAVRTVATLSPTLQTPRIVWSSDSQGLLYATETEGYGGVRGGAGRSTIASLDLTTTDASPTEAMPPLTDGFFYVPLAWDRAKKIVAAVLSGEGGFTPRYAVGDPAGVRTMEVTGGSSTIAGQVEASPDASRVLSIDMGANVVRIWPIADATKAVEVAPGPGQRIRAAHWMPDGASVAWSLDTQFGTFIPQTDTSRVVYAASGGVFLVALRPDGSAAVLSAPGGLQVTDMRSGGASQRAQIGDHVLPRGVFLR